MVNVATPILKHQCLSKIASNKIPQLNYIFLFLITVNIYWENLVILAAVLHRILCQFFITRCFVSRVFKLAPPHCRRFLLKMLCSTYYGIRDHVGYCNIDYYGVHTISPLWIALWTFGQECSRTIRLPLQAFNQIDAVLVDFPFRQTIANNDLSKSVTTTSR